MTVAMVGVVVSFVAAGAYSRARLGSIDQDVDAIVGQAVPSVDKLSTAREGLRRLEATVDGYAFALSTNDHDARSAVTRARDTLAAALDVLRSVSLPPDDAALRDDCVCRLAALDGYLDRATAAADRGDSDGARRTLYTELHPVADDIEASLRRLSQHALDRATRRAGHIERLRRRAARWERVLDGASVAIAILATLLALRSARRHARLVAAYTRLLVERSEELERFAGRVAHDIRSPLSSILLRLDVAARASVTDTSDKIRATVHHVLRLVDGLLAFATAQARRDPDARCAVDEVVAEVVAQVQPEATVAATRVTAHLASPGAVACSEGVVTSVVSNLVRNAIKFSATVPPERRSVTVRTSASAMGARVEVSDTGPGVPSGLRRTLFEPFVRGPGGPPGFGIGLATVKRLVEAHGGHVGVESVEGEGSRFWLELPRAPSQEPHELA